MLLETDQPTGPGRFTHHASPDILVMSMATDEAREAVQAEDTAGGQEPEEENNDEQTGPPVN